MGKIHDRFKSGKTSRPAMRVDHRARTMLNRLETNREVVQRALKGVKDGNCNRTACQRPGAFYFNRGTNAYYCWNCALDINAWSPPDYELFPGLEVDEREPWYEDLRMRQRQQLQADTHRESLR